MGLLGVGLGWLILGVTNIRPCDWDQIAHGGVTSQGLIAEEVPWFATLTSVRYGKRHIPLLLPRERGRQQLVPHLQASHRQGRLKNLTPPPFRMSCLSQRDPR